MFPAARFSTSEQVVHVKGSYGDKLCCASIDPTWVSRVYYRFESCHILSMLYIPVWDDVLG